MANRRIYDQERRAHFVTFSCYHRRRMLDGEPLRDRLLDLLAEKLDEYGGICSGFVVMPDHVHLIVWFGKPGGGGIIRIEPMCKASDIARSLGRQVKLEFNYEQTLNGHHPS